MENPDLVLQETGSRPTYSRLNYVPSGDTLRRDAISCFFFRKSKIPHYSLSEFENFNCYISIKVLLLLSKLITK